MQTIGALTLISTASRSKKKKKHDILFPEEVVVKEEPGLEKPREKVCPTRVSCNCVIVHISRLSTREYPYTTTTILENARRRNGEIVVGRGRGVGGMIGRGAGERREGEGNTFSTSLSGYCY